METAAAVATLVAGLVTATEVFKPDEAGKGTTHNVARRMIALVVSAGQLYLALRVFVQW